MRTKEPAALGRIAFPGTWRNQIQGQRGRMTSGLGATLVRGAGQTISASEKEKLERQLSNELLMGIEAHWEQTGIGSS